MSLANHISQGIAIWFVSSENVQCSKLCVTLSFLQFASLHLDLVTESFEESSINIELNDGSPKVGLVLDGNRYTNLYAVVLLCNRVIPTDQVFWQLQPSLTQSFSQFNWQGA